MQQQTYRLGEDTEVVVREGESRTHFGITTGKDATAITLHPRSGAILANVIRRAFDAAKRQRSGRSRRD